MSKSYSVRTQEEKELKKIDMPSEEKEQFQARSLKKSAKIINQLNQWRQDSLRSSIVVS